MPETDTPQKLIETVREMLERSAKLLPIVSDYPIALEALSQLEATLGDKTVPLAMIKEILDYDFDITGRIGKEELKDLDWIVSKHMPDFKVE